MKSRLQNMEAGLLFAIIAGIFFLFGVDGNNEEPLMQGRSAVVWMLGRWNWAATDMSHGWIIPLVSLYMVWRRMAELRDSPKTVSIVGFVVIVSALLVYLMGLRIQQTALVLMSLIGLLWGITFALYGRTVARILLFPCGYLIFCIPMTFMDYLTFPLRFISATVSVTLLNGLGISVTQLGTAIHVNTGKGFALDVAHPCSGLRYLLAMVALTTAYAYFTQSSAIKRGILSLASVPLAMAGNIARITLIAIVGVLFGETFAVGFYHDYSGYVVFAVATMLMLGLGAFLNRCGSTWRTKGKESKPHEF